VTKLSILAYGFSVRFIDGAAATFDFVRRILVEHLPVNAHHRALSCDDVDDLLDVRVNLRDVPIE
jgi:hypothetical protein